MNRSHMLSALAGFAISCAACIAQDVPNLLDRLAVNGVTFSGTTLDAEAVVDVGDGQDLHLTPDGALEVRDRESNNLLLSGIIVFAAVNKDYIDASVTNATHKFTIHLEASKLTNSGVTLDGTVVSSGVKHALAPIWVEDTAANAETLSQMQPVPIPIPQNPPMRGKYACICAWTNRDGTTGYRIGCAKQDCNIQTQCTSDGQAPSATESGGATTTAAAANITGRCMWVDSSDPNGAQAPVVLISALTSSTLASLLFIHRRRRAHA